MPAASYCDRCLTTFVGEPGACTNMACGAEKPPGGWDVVLERGDILHIIAITVDRFEEMCLVAVAIHEAISRFVVLVKAVRSRR